MSSEPLAKLAEEFFQASLNSSPTSAIMRGHKKYFDQIEELMKNLKKRWRMFKILKTHLAI